MHHARPEYAIVLAIIGILVAIGVPALMRGAWLTGLIMVALALAVATWAGIAVWRERHWKE